MSSSFWWAVAAYLLPTFPLGYFWHLKTFRAQYSRLEVYRDQVIVPLGLSTMVLQSVLFAWAYPHLFSTAHDAWLGSALRFGVFFGVLALSFATLPAAAKYRMSSVSAFVRLETTFTVVHFTIVSPLIALAWRTAA